VGLSNFKLRQADRQEQVSENLGRSQPVDATLA
jgi:hypothetical protein